MRAKSKKGKKLQFDINKIDWKLVVPLILSAIALTVLVYALNTNLSTNTKAANATCSAGSLGPKVPCIISSCGSQGCPEDQRMNQACPAGATNCSACCYASAIGKCTPAGGCGSNNGNNEGGEDKEKMDWRKATLCYNTKCKSLCGGLSAKDAWSQRDTLSPPECRECAKKCTK